MTGDGLASTGTNGGFKGLVAERDNSWRTNCTPGSQFK